MAFGRLNGFEKLPRASSEYTVSKRIGVASNVISPKCIQSDPAVSLPL